MLAVQSLAGDLTVVTAAATPALAPLAFLGGGTRSPPGGCRDGGRGRRRRPLRRMARRGLRQQHDYRAWIPDARRGGGQTQTDSLGSARRTDDVCRRCNAARVGHWRARVGSDDRPAVHFHGPVLDVGRIGPISTDTPDLLLACRAWRGRLRSPVSGHTVQGAPRCSSRHWWPATACPCPGQPAPGSSSFALAFILPRWESCPLRWRTADCAACVHPGSDGPTFCLRRPDLLPQAA